MIKLLNFKMVLSLIITHLPDYQVPKLSDGLHNAENQRSLPDVVGTKKQVSYKTEIIGGVPIVTQTQVKLICSLLQIRKQILQSLTRLATLVLAQ